jgi:hypothetical protein
VRATAQRTPAGTVIRFLRCGRREADGWEAQDIPLGEASEAYRLAVWRDGVERRVLTANATSILYAASEELADFGVPQSRLDVDLRQISAAVGPGFALRTTLTID